MPYGRRPVDSADDRLQRSPGSRAASGRAGTPTTVASGATSATATAPAPRIARSPAIIADDGRHPEVDLLARMDAAPDNGSEPQEAVLADDRVMADEDPPVEDRPDADHRSRADDHVREHQRGVVFVAAIASNDLLLRAPPGRAGLRDRSIVSGRASSRAAGLGFWSMKIAIMGTRGVPAAYGGFETFAEELGARLAARGHAVTVYGRAHVVPDGLREHRGIRLRVLPTIRHKYLDTVAHTALSVLDGLFRGFDVVLICNNANAPLALVPRLAGAKVALNVDGLEWQRGKWNRLGRWYYQACAALSPKLPIVLVSDARVIAQWYREHYRRATVLIPYGADTRRLPPGETLARFGLAGGRYLLYVSRLEPENHADTVIEAYGRAGGLAGLGIPLVAVGDAPYATGFKASIEALASATPGTILTGYVFGDGYVELQSNTLLYVQATEVGGTHPALVEAMGRGACIVANDVPEHREVLGDAGEYYARNDTASLAVMLSRLVDDGAERARLGVAAAERAAARFSWDHVTDEYETLFERMLTGRRA